MKILNANPGMGIPMTEQQAKTFLESDKLNVHIGTIDNEGQPNVHPAWYYYDSKIDKLYFETGTSSRKIANITKNNIIYFCIDKPTFPYRGVRGKGRALISKELKFNISISEKIMVKYLGSLEHPMAKQLLDWTKKGEQLTIEVTPMYFSTWDFSAA